MVKKFRFCRSLDKLDSSNVSNGEEQAVCSLQADLAPFLCENLIENH